MNTIVKCKYRTAVNNKLKNLKPHLMFYYCAHDSKFPGEQQCNYSKELPIGCPLILKP